MRYLISIVFAFSIHIGMAQSYTEINKIVASDRNEDGRFGQAVAIEGNYAVVGAYGADANGPNKGQAYIFEYISGNWTQTQILTSSDEENYDRFGWSVAINGDYIVVGATGEDDDLTGANAMAKAGAAYIFQNQAGTWVEVQKIIASDRSIDDEFGWSLDISDSTLIVGAHQDFEDVNGLNPIHHAGSVYIFDLDPSGVWNQTQKIVASDRAPDINYPNGYTGEDLSDQFGHSVGISGDYLIVGALNHDYTPTGTSTWQCGSAYIFERSSGGTWVQVQQIINSDNAAGIWERFGSDVAIDTNYIAVGLWSQDYSTTGTDYMKNAGAIYIFERDLAGSWNETQKLVPGARNSGDHFGWDVKLDGDLLITGSEQDNHDENDLNDLSDAGSAYIFKKDGAGIYSQIQKISASDRDSLDEFGYAVDISFNNAIVGAFKHDYNVLHADSIDEAGASYIFSACTGPILTTQDTSICFGTSLNVGTSNYTASGTYTDNLVSSLGCDSIVTTNLTVRADINVNQNITICNTESYTIGTSTYTTEGTFTDVLTTVNSGCDSTVNTTLSFYPDNGISQTITICEGDSFTVGTSTYTAEGTYSDIFTSVINGCDSTVSTTIVFYAPNSVSPTVSICPGESYEIGTSSYTTAGTYTDILTSVVTGCDSIVNTTLTLNSAFDISQNITICYGESYLIGNSTYTAPGTYTDTLIMSTGFCDSIVHTNLSVNLPIDISLDVDGNTIESNENGAFYQWLDCDDNYAHVSTAISNEQEIIVTETGNYSVRIYENGCVDTSACVYVNYVTLKENETTTFNIYPNPTHGSFTIELDNSNTESYSITILNNIGEIVYNQIDINNSLYNVDGLNLAKGIYSIEIKTKTSRQFKKIVIQ